ncbi:MAG: substrate-binding domain-containing protein [Prevotella sp.]|nr:substrate-binding domain-containing protein [Prevotella sp.]
MCRPGEARQTSLRHLNKLLFILLALTAISCTERQTYKIGVSQCSEDIWREKQNDELRMCTYLYDNATLEFASADDDDQVQIQQINRFIDEGVDLLIVSPNQVNTVSSAIDRAYDKHIPVILFDRKSDSKKYTAFMGADNLEMGSMIGKYITALKSDGVILEIKGLKGSSPAQERHDGFVKGITDESRLVTCDGDWTQQSGYRLMDSVLQKRKDIVCVFGQNDRMAVGAYEAAKKHGLEKNMMFVGIDALPTKDGGIELVRNKILSASYIYPTRGDLLLQLAMNILEGKPYERENLLKSALVTHENAEVMLMQAEEMNQQNERLTTLNDKVNVYLSQYHHQQVYLVLMTIIALLMIGWLWYRIHVMRRRHRLEREAFALVVGSQSSVVPSAPAPVETEAPADESEEGKTTKNVADVADSITYVSEEQKEIIDADGDYDANFLDHLRQLVQEQMTSSDFGVESLAGEMGLSRVQLYRKVKALTGRTPVDIIRLSRLNRAKALLAKGSRNVSEVAYDVGFSSPSYFTKCFKDEFGMLPGEVK